MNVRLVFLTFLFQVSLFATASAQGYAGLGSEAEDGFSTVTPGQEISFPADHGPHRNFRIEWWYLTANLTDEKGLALGLQWTLFRNALTPEVSETSGWQSRQFWLGHSAVTTADIHLSAEIFARGGVGQANVQSVPFSAWIDDWKMTSLAPPSANPLSHLVVQASSQDFSYHITLTANMPLVRHGKNGFSQKSNSGQASYYYSQPFFDVTGTVVIEGSAREVKGKAWLDREWSSQPLAAHQTGWDWFSLHLKSGAKLMLFRLRQKNGSFYYSGSHISKAGEVSTITGDQVTFTPLDISDVAGRQIPTSWQITLQQKNLTLTVTPLNPQSWMDNSFGYWEGPVTIKGSDSGVGYLEMTGY